MKNIFKTIIKFSVLFVLLPISVFALTIYTVPQGGTGVGSISGLLKGNGTSAFSVASPGTDYVVPSALSSYIPYTGATSNVDLGTHTFTANGIASKAGGLFAGAVSPFPTGYGTYVANYVSGTYGARILAYDGTNYQPLYVGKLISGSTFQLALNSDGTSVFGGSLSATNLSGTNTGDNATNSTSNSYADGKVVDSIVDGYTTIAPSGNAVFDALALKAPLLSPIFDTLLTINKTSGNPEFDFTIGGVVKSKTYWDNTNARLTFQNNANNNADALYFADPVTTTGNIVVGSPGTSAGSVATIDATQSLTNKTVDGVTPTTMAFVDPTSSIQTQLNSKGTFTLPSLTSGSILFSDGSTIAQDNTNLFFNTTNKQLGVGTNTFLSTGNVINAKATNTGTTQINVQNGSNGTSASSDMVATADTGTDSTNYVDMGINSSTYSDAGYTIGGPLSSYLYSNGGDLAIGTQTASKVIKFHTGGTLAANLRATISDTGFNLPTGLTYQINGVDQLALKANLASPTFSGTPSLPTGTTGVTQSVDNNSTKLATTAYVDAKPIWKAITATRVSNTTFTLVGDQTAIFRKGLIVKWTESATVRVAMVSIPSTFSTTTTVTIVGDTMASIDASSFKYSLLGVEPFIAQFAIAGNIGATGTDVANAYYATEPMRVLGADMQVGTAGTTNSTTINIVNGTGTVTLVSPTLATTVAATATPQAPAASALSLALNDRIQVNITAIQTTNAVDLYAQLYLLPTRYLNL